MRRDTRAGQPARFPVRREKFILAACQPWHDLLRKSRVWSDFPLFIVEKRCNMQAIRIKKPKNLTQIGFPSLQSVMPDRLPGPS
jgi:hypothetical protein